MLYENKLNIHYRDYGYDDRLPRPVTSEGLATDIANAFAGAHKITDQAALNQFDVDAIRHAEVKGHAYGYRNSLTKSIDRFVKSSSGQDLLECCKGSFIEAGETAATYLDFGTTKKGEKGFTKFLSIQTSLAFLERMIGEMGPEVVGKLGAEAFSTEMESALALLPYVNHQYEFAAHETQITEDVPWPEDDLYMRRINSYREVMRANKSKLVDIMSGDEMAAVQYVTKQTLVTQFYSVINQPRKIVVLLDVSGSMEQHVPRKINGNRYRRIDWARAGALSLTKNAIKGANEVVLIYFDGQQSDPISGKPEQIYRAIADAGYFTGGGTSISGALEAAATHNPDAIVLITDGTDVYFDPPTTELHTVVFGVDNDELRNGSFKYYPDPSWGQA